jgi:hypothetical protein
LCRITGFEEKMTMKRSVFWAPLALASLLFAAACEQAAGTGGSPPDITLNSAADLAKIGATADYPLNGKYALGKSLDLKDWMPIGIDEPFTGTFDGRGKTLAIAGSGGLFAFAKGAVIRNLTVTGTIHASGSGTVFAGGILGNGDNTTIISCVSTANITVEARGHNSSAGGIAGFMTNYSIIADCRAGGNISISSGEEEGLMLYAGGIAGYQGLAGSSSDGFSGCIIERCSFTGGSVTAEGSYPYAGGVAGYNYVGAILRESYAAGGSVTARGKNLPYAGGVSGYNSRNAENPSLIENCYSDMTVHAEAASKQAQAGGISAANAADARISKCYARGSVTATVVGSGSGDSGGSIGVAAAASAGGIAGAQYVGAPSIKSCVALNTKIEGRGSGAGYQVYRIASLGAAGGSVWEANIAAAALYKDGVPADPQPDPSGYDGGYCGEKPAQSAYEALGWDFASIWKMGAAGYPVLRNNEQ